MSTVELAPDQPATSESLPEPAERYEALMAEADELLSNGDPWKALPKKAEALGLKPLEGALFTSMREQDVYKRPDLHWAGHPLADAGDAVGRSMLRAAAELFPSGGGPETLLSDLKEAAGPRHQASAESHVAQARDALDEIRAKAKEIQYKQAFNEVGYFNRHAGWLAARAGNGDLLVAPDTPDTQAALAAAGYREVAGGYGSHGGPTVPFNNTGTSTEGVRWTKATGAEPDVT